MVRRINFNTLKEPSFTRNLISDQIGPYKSFLLKKKNKGIESVLKDVFPVISNDGRFRLEYFKYRLVLPECTGFDCIYKGTTYLTSLYIHIKLFKNSVLEQSSEVFLGNIPLMTKKGSFIINGSERVVIAQLNRSPGVFFNSNTNLYGIKTYYLKIIPDKGVWIEIHINDKGILYANLDKKKKNKILVTTLLKVLGKTNTNDILKEYYKVKGLLDIKNITIRKGLELYLLDNVVDVNYNIVAKKYTLVDNDVIDFLRKKKIPSINCIDVSEDSGIFLKTIRQDFLPSYEESLISFYKKIKPLENVNKDSANLFVHKLFRDFKNYDLGLVGRHRLNSKLRTKVVSQFRNLYVYDVVKSIKYLVALFLNKEGYSEDDIDDLSLKKLRTCGDLICNSFKVGLSKVEKVLKEKLLFYNVNVDFLNLQKLIYSKNVTLTIRDFFNRSQLSQFMDQINPLAEITHKRRVTSLGPGGLSKDRAGFDVRDVHSSHYGRICPIETPEGPNIGLINSLSLYTHINDFGFLETPYQELSGGLKTGKILYLDSFKEAGFYIGQSSYLNEGSNIIVRKQHTFFEVEKGLIDFVDLSPKQLISIATALIPFIEHNDANRALMGSNMQRQSVPLLVNEKPYVGSGLELQVSKDSTNTVYSEYDCRVVYLDPYKALTLNLLKEEVNLYRFLKFFRTNSSTCFNHKVIVKPNEIVKKGGFLVDGPSSDKGELSLGKNVLVAFMP
jgi:DNA-directed RNA polymerase subunit beta